MNINEITATTNGGGVKFSESVIPSTYSSSSFNVLIDRDCTISPVVKSLKEHIDTMYYYARDHIPNYQNITTYPNDIQYNPDTNGVTNFGHAFFDMNKCTDTIGSIMNRFDWNSCTNMSWTFALCYKLTGSIPNIPNSVTDMSHAFWFCGFITGHIPNIPNSVTDMSSTFQYCSNLTGPIPNIPNSVTDMSYTFSDCSKLSSSNVYIHSNNVINATSCFRYMRNIVNIYVHAGTTTYNSFYKAMGRKTYNSVWNSYLKTF